MRSDVPGFQDAPKLASQGWQTSHAAVKLRQFICTLAMLGFWTGCGGKSPPSALEGASAGPANPSGDGPARGSASGPGPVGSGGTAGGQAPIGGVDSADSAAGRALFARMQQAYRQRATYRDAGTVTVEPPGGAPPSTTRLQLTFRRPSQFRLEIAEVSSQLLLQSDGRLIRTTVRDATTRDFGGQIVERPVESPLGVPQIYSAAELLDPATPQQRLSLLLGVPVRLDVTPLGLLLDEAYWQSNLPGMEYALLSDERLAGQTYRRLKMRRAEGEYVLWIDPQSGLLRRLEYPPVATGEGGSGADVVRIRGDFPLVAGDDALVEQDFALPRLEGVTAGRYFVLPPRAAQPGNMGQQLADYSFVNGQGVAEGSGTWAGRIAVLMWFQPDEASSSALQQLQQVFQAHRNSDRVTIRAVLPTSAAGVSAEDGQRFLQSLSVEVPVVFDNHGAGRDQFQVSETPTLIVLDAERRIQWTCIGALPDAGTQVKGVLEQLLAGRSVAEQQLALQQQLQASYERELAVARSAEQTPVAAAAEAAPLAPASPPQLLKWREVWRSQEVEQPGNWVAADPSDRDRSPWLLSGWNKVVRLDGQGKLRTTQELPIEAEDLITYLQPAWGGQHGPGEPRWLGGARLGRVVYVFDRDWKRVLRYPAASDSQTGIHDATLADLDHDGRVELFVGFAGSDGVHQVDSRGERRWAFTETPPVLSTVLGAGSQPEQLLVTAADGYLRALNAQGRLVAQPQLAQPLQQLARSDHGREELEPISAESRAVACYCGLMTDPSGELWAVGWDVKCQAIWRFPLARGMYRSQILFPLSSRLGAQKRLYWWLPGADGSLGLVRDDGQWQDRWQVGADVRGLYAHRVQDRDWLWLATDQYVALYELQGL